MKRLFIETSKGQLHARSHTGDPPFATPPLVMLHAAPGSALMLSNLQVRFKQRSLAIDLPGMGDSDPLPIRADKAEPTIGDFTDMVEQAIRDIYDEPVDVYGTLSGVRVALELANRHVLPVRRVVLDGIGIPKSEQLDELLADYAPDFTPDINGNHLMNTFQLCRDQYLFYPWYARDAEHRRPTGLPSAAALHTKVMESLKSAVAFRPLIRAAFRYDCAAALAALKQPALITADGSAVRGDLPLLEFPPAEPLTCAPDLLDKRAARIAAFLDS
ncbi:MAG: alpha/beta fold hydrolase [Burkholderiales bacterium]|jgi:pimeloyl-ACP methyl ester carboxylesterase|nr:alpha/beta hydrolase [Betaproteobacteria bacterium]